MDVHDLIEEDFDDLLDEENTCTGKEEKTVERTYTTLPSEDVSETAADPAPETDAAEEA